MILAACWVERVRLRGAVRFPTVREIVRFPNNAEPHTIRVKQAIPMLEMQQTQIPLGSTIFMFIL